MLACMRTGAHQLGGVLMAGRNCVCRADPLQGEKGCSQDTWEEASGYLEAQDSRRVVERAKVCSLCRSLSKL